MFNAKPATKRSLNVTVIGHDLATIEGLGGYLRRRFAFRAVLASEEPSEEAMRSDCVVLYPDELPRRSAQRLARRLISCPTVSLAIIVTALPAAERRTLVGSRSSSNRLCPCLRGPRQSSRRSNQACPDGIARPRDSADRATFGWVVVQPVRDDLGLVADHSHEQE